MSSVARIVSVSRISVGTIFLSGMMLCVLVGVGEEVGAGTLSPPSQINPLRQDSIKLPAVPEVQRQTIAPTLMANPSVEGEAVLSSPSSFSEGGSGFGYDPSGRRDPFAPVVQQLQPGKMDVNLPPLQRVNLTELNLIAIVWGAYGYTAMVQTPEGYGYAVRRGTRLGQNNGVVSAITERGIIVQERFTDVYGKKQEREYVKLLHPKEGAE
ncbi:putative Type IV pilus assembly protein PilP [Nitrospira lenta]|uniref:Putative Type IV pilus assembly protein PilP n=1 Tax=Nitrospira lenta TaxID=1436998 RepID=A0A330L4N3_9BACT|nr:putative Type IV pilus assembly protein PilP [Nitrospira lenta]